MAAHWGGLFYARRIVECAAGRKPQGVSKAMKVRSFLWSLIVVSLALISAPAFAQSSDLSVTKSGPSTAAAGTDVAYDISLVNLGPDGSALVTLNDNLPAGMTFVSLVQNSGPTFSCSDPGVGNNGSITCTLATMTSGSSADFTLTVHIAPATPPSTFFTNTATITCATDPNSENDASTAVTSTPSNDADVSVTKNGPSSAAPNSDVAYTISVVNNGPATATTVVLNDTLHSTMTFVSVVQNTGPAAACAPAGLSSASCSFASPLANGAMATFTLTVNVPVTVTDGTVLVNNVNVSTGSFDTNSANNTAQVSTTVIGVTDLAVSKSGPGSVNAGSNLTYTIAVTNSGASAATSAALSDAIPANVTFVSEGQNSGPAASCSNPSVGGTGTITCTWASLAGGANATFTVVVHVPGNATGSVTNTATVSSTTGDTNHPNDSSTTTATIVARADVNITHNDPSPVIR